MIEKQNQIVNACFNEKKIQLQCCALHNINCNFRWCLIRWETVLLLTEVLQCSHEMKETNHCKRLIGLWLVQGTKVQPTKTHSQTHARKIDDHLVSQVTETCLFPDYMDVCMFSSANSSSAVAYTACEGWMWCLLSKSDRFLSNRFCCPNGAVKAVTRLIFLMDFCGGELMLFIWLQTSTNDHNYTTEQWATILWMPAKCSKWQVPPHTSTVCCFM